MTDSMHVHSWGAGPPVVLVHGGVLGGRETWRAQRPLTERWTLLAPDRPGHGRTPGARQDFESEAQLLADQLLDHRCIWSASPTVGSYRCTPPRCARRMSDR